MITMWRLRHDTIEPVECSKVTAFYVWPVDLDGCREARESDWNSYHESWAEAHVVMLRNAERHVAAARRQLEHAQVVCDRVKGMKPPKPPVDAEVSQ